MTTRTLGELRVGRLDEVKSIDADSSHHADEVMFTVFLAASTDARSDHAFFYLSKAAACEFLGKHALGSRVSLQTVIEVEVVVEDVEST